MKKVKTLPIIMMMKAIVLGKENLAPKYRESHTTKLKKKRVITNPKISMTKRCTKENPNQLIRRITTAKLMIKVKIIQK